MCVCTCMCALLFFYWFSLVTLLGEFGNFLLRWCSFFSRCSRFCITFGSCYRLATYELYSALSSTEFNSPEHLLPKVTFLLCCTQTDGTGPTSTQFSQRYASRYDDAELCCFTSFRMCMAHLTAFTVCSVARTYEDLPFRGTVLTVEKNRRSGNGPPKAIYVTTHTTCFLSFELSSRVFPWWGSLAHSLALLWLMAGTARIRQAGKFPLFNKFSLNFTHSNRALA